MNKTTFTKDITLGKLDGENVKLAKPSWDCGWYWGFGYIQNRDLHTHFSCFDKENNRNLMDSIRARFTEWTLTETDTWTFCELIQTMYTLKETAEVLGRGSSHYSSNPCKELIINRDEVERINKVVLPAIFDAIYTLFIDGPQRKIDEQKKIIEKEKEYANKKIDEARKTLATCEEALKNLNI